MLVELPISPNDAGQRAERFLRRWFPRLGVGRLQSLFRRKEIKVAKKPVAQGYLLQAGDVLQVYGLRPEEADRPEAGAPTASEYPPPPVLFEDGELFVVDKPAGMAAHPGTGIPPGASLIERVRGRPGIHAGGWGTELFSPSLVHRLDKETSGVLLVAKTGAALRALTKALRDGRIRKRYLALVSGHPDPAAGTIDAALARTDSAAGAKSRTLKGWNDGDGKPSVTRYKTVRAIGEHALLRVILETGRMHQIRAHLAHIGHPIVGDTRYSGERPAAVRARMKTLGLTRLFLHAEELAWTDADGTQRIFRAPLPEELSRVCAPSDPE